MEDDSDLMNCPISGVIPLGVNGITCKMGSYTEEMGIMVCVWTGDQKGQQGIQRDPLNPL